MGYDSSKIVNDDNLEPFFRTISIVVLFIYLESSIPIFLYMTQLSPFS
jgi:hypothetical protein